MEVDAVSFPHHLLGMLVAISEADFVSFDLEYSGIPNRMPNRAARQGNGRQTLEDRYIETKAGAERYSILQVGITCTRFDYIQNNYVLRPYNVNLSPLLDERLDFERDVTFQAGAVSFLMNNGFQMESPFTKGVPYLSRQEAQDAKQRAYDRADKKNLVADLQLKEEDVDSLDFVARVREEITKFKTNISHGLEITTHTGLKEQPALPAISRFEKRLVHQLVRAEFPEFVTISKSDCILIKEFDPVREADNIARQKRFARERIVKGTGFRWIFEALAQGDIDLIDPFYFAKNPSGTVIAADMDSIKARFDRATQRLKDQQPVLVGHNMFTDLVYLYQCFVGKLPNTLPEFCEAIHELFPKIVDTKYLATFAGGDLNASPTLQEIAEGLKMQRLPDIVTHVNHGKYHDTKALHEAGYDSLLTATIMLRLSTKVDVERQEKLAVDSESNGDISFKVALEEQGGVSLIDLPEKVSEPVYLPPIEDPSIHIVPSDPETNLSPDTHLELNGKKKKKSKSKKKKKKNTASEKTTNRKFATDNVFESLRDLSIKSEVEVEDEDDVAGEPLKVQPTGQAIWDDEPYVQDKSSWVKMKTVKREPMELVPDFDSEFWREFGNKLRIFGTQELSLKIADWPKKT